MKLLYVLVDDLVPIPDELERLTTVGRALVGSGSTFTVEPIPIGPRHYYESAVGLALAVPGILAKITERQDDFDAVLLGCFGDPGLRAARAVATIPVIGAAEAATALVRLVAQRYGVVTIEASDVPEIEVYLSSLEAREQCVGIDSIDLPYYGLVRDPADTLHRITEASKPLVLKGAQAILLGCMSFGFYPFAAQLQQSLDVPVIDPLRAGISAAQAMLMMGVLPTARAIPRLADSRPLIQHLGSLPRIMQQDAVELVADV